MRERITKKVVDAAVAPPSGELRIRDSGIPGFCLRVRGGRKVYAFRYGTGQRRSERWITIGEHGGPWRPGPDGKKRELTADLAREEATRLRGLVVSGADPAAHRDSERAIPLLKDFAARYLREHAQPNKAAQTADANERNLTNHILPAFGSRRLDHVTTADVTRWHLSMRESPVAANRSLALLSHLFTMARKWGVLPQAHPHPCMDVQRYKEAKRKRYLSELELVRLGAALAEAEAPKPPRRGVPSCDPYACAAIRALLFTGARIGEIVSLEWKMVDLDAGVAMQRRKGRGAEQQPIHLPPPLVQLLSDLPRRAGNPYVFPGKSQGRHISREGVSGTWWRVRESAGLDDVHIHDLRHSFASVAVAGGNTLAIIGGLLGHTQVQTTARYAHLSRDPLARAASETAKVIDAALRRGSGSGS